MTQRDARRYPVARRFFLAGGVAALAAALVVAVVAYRTQASPAPAARLQGTVVWPAHMRPAPAFSLRDQNGRLVTLAELRGSVWAITFLDSHCTKACPVAGRSLAQVQAMLGSGDSLKVVIVTVLPQYDTPARVRAFARTVGLAGDWHWLLGTPGDLAPVWREYGVWVQSGVSHTAALYLVDRHGDVRVADAIPFVPSQLASSVRALTAQSSGG